MGTPSIVYNKDCMEVMRSFPDKHFDLAIVDPPYGLKRQSHKGGGKLKNRVFSRVNASIWDKQPGEDYFLELFRVSKN